MYVVSRNTGELTFPPAEEASPEGLLAIGGDLGLERVLAAYRKGIFPWYNPGQPVLWWCPDPRTVLYLDELKISRSLRRRLRKGRLRVTMDRDFSGVVNGCAAPRRANPSAGTWITDDMFQAYCRLAEEGYAHSVETWLDDCLVGGLYGVSLGRAFFGESMFSFAADASKVALVYLVCQLRRWDFAFIDCQLPSEHVFRLGAHEIRRARFLFELREALAHTDRRGIWRLDPDLEPVS